MLKYLLILVLIAAVYASDFEDDKEGDVLPLPGQQQLELSDDNFETTTEPASVIADFVTIIEQLTVTAQNTYREGSLPIKYHEQLYDQITDKYNEIIDEISHLNNANKFIDAKGIQRIIIPNINFNYDQIRKRVLALVKILFEEAPSKTNATMPVYIIDKLLNIFENDDDVDLKTLSLDILYIWLPNNPKLQARVMKLKGLEPFYNQISKLDVHVSHKLLDLFNKILEEHLNARKNTAHKSIIDLDTVKLYQVIGLVERMSTPIVCNGFLNIFDILFNSNNKVVSEPVFKLVNSVKRFCLKVYKGKSKAIKMFDDFSSFISNEKTTSYLEELGLNVTEMKTDLMDYVYKLRENIKTEL